MFPPELTAPISRRTASSFRGSGDGRPCRQCWASSPTRNPLEDVTNHQQSTALSLWAEGSKEGDSDNQSIRENSTAGTNGSLIIPCLPSTFGISSLLAPIVQRAIDAADDASETPDPRPLVVIEGALSLLEKIDAAVCAVQSSRRKARSRNNPTESTTANPSSQKKPWRERSKDTIWDDPKSIIANSPLERGRSTVASSPIHACL